ncbi:MAG: hypothetical protein U0667_09525 [Chloroflexota bacterium]
MVPTATALAAVVNPASGGTRVSADQAGTSRFTPLTGPAIAESGLSELSMGSTTVLNMPSGFRFNTRSGSLNISGKDCDLRARIKVTTTQATMTVTQASSISGCIVTFVGLEVQPTAGGGITSGNITKTGTSSAPAGATNYGTLTKVPGAVAELVYLTQPSGTNNGGTPFGTQPRILARDQFGNEVPRASVKLSITSGTGAKGAHLRCDTNPVRTDGSGIADFAGDACRIDKAGRYRLRAASGHGARNSGTFSVVVGPASKLVFRGYPASTTRSTLSDQPSVAVADAGGNTVTSFPPTEISIAINKHSSTFSCTGGLRATTVRGVARFRGCRQRTSGTGYRLTAVVGFAATLGGAFRVR